MAQKRERERERESHKHQRPELKPKREMTEKSESQRW
jgi:hypothetical protein